MLIFSQTLNESSRFRWNGCSKFGGWIERREHSVDDLLYRRTCLVDFTFLIDRDGLPRIRYDDMDLHHQVRFFGQVYNRISIAQRKPSTGFHCLVRLYVLLNSLHGASHMKSQ